MPLPKALPRLTAKKRKRVSKLLRAGRAPVDILPETNAPAVEVSRSEPAERLRQLARGFKLAFRWIPGMFQVLSGQEKDEWLSQELTEKQRAAASVKKQLYPKHKALTLLSSARTQVKHWFESRTNPFPERGIRIFLVNAGNIEEQTSEELAKYEAEQVAEFRRNLQLQIDTVFAPAVTQLQEQWPEVLEAARAMLVDKYDPDDYVRAEQLPNLVRCWFEPVNLELSKEWAYLSESERERELALIRQKYELAVQKQEEFVVSLLQEALNDLCSSLAGFNAGQQRTVRESTVRKVFDAVEEFRNKTVRYGILKESALEDIVNRVNRLIKNDGHDSQTLASDLRSREATRARFMTSVESIKTELSGLVQSGQVRRKIGTSL